MTQPLHPICLDVHAYVLARLDTHLEDLHRLRGKLAGRQATTPGERRRLATITAVQALSYVRDIDAVLDADRQPLPRRSMLTVGTEGG